VVYLFIEYARGQHQHQQDFFIEQEFIHRNYHGLLMIGSYRVCFRCPSGTLAAEVVRFADVSRSCTSVCLLLSCSNLFVFAWYLYLYYIILVHHFMHVLVKKSKASQLGVYTA